MQESLSEICHARLPLVVLNMARGQGDYFQATRGGGHGDYRHIVLAPTDVTEAVELVQLAFHLADRWRNPVMFLGDYFLAHVLEAVEVEPARFPPAGGEVLEPGRHRAAAAARPSSISPLGSHKRGAPGYVDHGTHLATIAEHVGAMGQGVEPLVETAWLDDAELVVVAYGTPGRYVRFAVEQLRDAGLPVGFARPITLWPFPRSAIAEAGRGRPGASPSTSSTPGRWSTTSAWPSSVDARWSSSAG